MKTMADAAQSGWDARSLEMRAQTQLDAVLDAAGDGVIMIDRRLTVLAFGRSAERLLGHGARDVIGRNVGLILPDLATMPLPAKTGGQPVMRQMEATDAEGRMLPIELSIAAAERGGDSQFVLILRDMRARLDSDRRLKELQGELLHLARVTSMNAVGTALAHEINQPLTALLLYLQTAEKLFRDLPAETPHAATIRDVLSRSGREAQRVIDIVKRIRGLAEKREPVRVETELASVIDDAIELTLVGRRSSARIERRYRAVGRAVIDPVQIQQVIVNLLSNALDAVAGHEGGVVTIEGVRARANVVITVGDNGPGIPPEQIGAMFRAFETRKRNGLGLGLSISQAIAHAHAGDLGVDPGGRGSGARFTLTLPAGLGPRAGSEDRP
jgi:two-component system, LuxR family, sensor kinase FixL